MTGLSFRANARNLSPGIFIPCRRASAHESLRVTNLLTNEHGVPTLHRRNAPVIAQDVQRRSTEKKVRSRRGRQSEPPGREYSKNMTVREKCNMPLHRADTRDHTINPDANLLGTFSARATIVKNHPPGSLRMDLSRCYAFVFAVIPFHQITVDFSALAEAG